MSDAKDALSECGVAEGKILDISTIYTQEEVTAVSKDSAASRNGSPPAHQSLASILWMPRRTDYPRMTLEPPVQRIGYAPCQNCQSRKVVLAD